MLSPYRGVFRPPARLSSAPSAGILEFGRYAIYRFGFQCTGLFGDALGPDSVMNTATQTSRGSFAIKKSYSIEVRGFEGSPIYIIEVRGHCLDLTKVRRGHYNTYATFCVETFYAVLVN